MNSLSALLLIAAAVNGASPDGSVDLSRATIVTRSGNSSSADNIASTVLIEEVEKRTGVRLPLSPSWPKDGAVIVVTSERRRVAGHAIPSEAAPAKAEGFGVALRESEAGQPILWILGADSRGVLFGVGHVLRHMDWSQGRVLASQDMECTSSPQYAIRGHQLGFRAQANSYDAWDAKQYDQYIRELAIFGVNCIENIPFQDDRPTPVMKVSRQEMNKAMSEICQRYGLDYWAWIPADFDLKDAQKRSEALKSCEAFFRDCPRFDAVFFPGGDPGDNEAALVMPFLADMAPLLLRHHPKAKIWMSLQGFDKKNVDYFYEWMDANHPTWFGGDVCGPSSPPIPESRARLPKQYGLRHYPDITHAVRAQYAAPWIDPAYAYTLGRECINPEPVYFSTIHNAFAPYTNGFLTYSDGIHDDVNKTIWSGLGWDSTRNARDNLVEYARFFFRPDIAEQAADGILALEGNWQGPLVNNGGVEATLILWEQLDAKAPELRSNWRWQMNLLRANYDAYTRQRQIFESDLESEANEVLRLAMSKGASPELAMSAAADVLKKADSHPVKPEWRARIFQLCDDLFHSIGLQTSVEKYFASGAERGAVLDYIDYPLNNRWWVEDQFTKIQELAGAAEKWAALERIWRWENPGLGSFYDDIGNVAKSPHVIRGEGVNTDPEMRRNPNPDFMWWNNGIHKYRQSWVCKMDWPLGLRYGGLDPDAAYEVRTTGNGDCLLKVDGERVKPTSDGREIGDVKVFPLEKQCYADREVVLTFDVPLEPGINWRQASRLSEVWLIRADVP